MNRDYASGRKQNIGQLVTCFGAGDLVAAERIARHLLAADRHDEEVLHLLAQITYRQGRPAESAELMKEVLELNPLQASYLNDYGVMLASLGRWDEAATAYGMAVVLDQNSIDARFNLALALFRTKQTDRARVELDRVMASNPDLPEAVVLSGELLRDEGRPGEAAGAFMKAIEQGLETSEVYVNLGLALEDLNRGEEAVQALQTANQLDDGDAAACFHLGNFYRNKGDKEKAEQLFRRAVALRPDFAEAHNNLGLLLQESGEAARAAECFEKALSSDPGMDAAHTNLGSSRVREGWMESAIDSFQRALEINPHSAEAWNNLGNVYFRLHRLEDAEDAYRRSLEIKPDYVEADLNLGILLLLCGNLAEGWPRYESRWKMPGVAEKRPKFSQPEWAGDPLGNRTLLVYSEQGMGDNLQFARYLPLLRQHYPNAKIYFWCLPPLYRLFQSCAAAWGVEALPPTVPGGLPPIDVQIALLSLPWRMGTTLESVPANIPYIAPPADLVGKWAARLAQLPGKKVGVVWASGEIYAFHKFRTVRLKQLEPLLGVDGISWVSLQKGNGAGQIVTEGLSERIYNPMDEVEDFADTAAIIANLDLVVSVDTSVPHLAGAMGVPVWLLDRFDTDWRWLLDRDDCPWYPTLRIFRQASFGDWAPVMERVHDVLRDAVGSAELAALPKENVVVQAENENDLPAHSGFEHEPEVMAQLFGSSRLNYKIVCARHGWMLANPNDFYIGQALLEYGEYNEIEAEFLQQCYFRNGRIVEVGANMGSHTVGLAKAAAARGERMDVFEPQPVVFQNLCANLALNGLQNVRAWPCACSDESGMVAFAEQNYGKQGNFGGVSMSYGTPSPGTITVPCVRLDDVLGEEMVALIKIDVEGFELAVLKGADISLKRWRPVLYVENDRIDASKDLIEWLWSRDYRLYWHIPPLFNPNNYFAKKFNKFGNVASFNMFCVPREFVGTVEGLVEVVDSSKHPLMK